jgi:outer membrane protein assembly factor BamB
MTDQHDDPFCFDRARELQLDALLHEAAGVLPAPNLAEVILDAIGRGARPGALRVGRRQRWLAAAVLLFGTGVVGGVFWLRGDGARQAAVVPAQEPEKQEPAPQQPAAKVDVTLIADYSANKVFEVDKDGKVLFELKDVFGAWDAERMPDGHYLITEFSVSRVSERDGEGKFVWSFEDLKNPYDADRLPNGNVLIADTFGGRVIEVEPDRATGEGGDIVWSYGNKEGQSIRPFDADRLPNGNTLIADVLGNRVLEVDQDGKTVWEAQDLPNAHDADRLPNGNTLVTLRSKGEVREIDPDGELVWRIKGLNGPSDADRLPNGNTLVAENEHVREFDADGKEVWRKKTAWAVEANRSQR